MRVFFCKSYCPLICSSKSSLRLYSPCPLKLEDARHVSSSPPPVAHVLGAKLSDEKTEVVKSESDDGKVDVLLKSSLKRSPGSGSTEVGKGRVKWMDDVGKELSEIREFEPIESENSEDNADGNPACSCVIQ